MKRTLSLLLATLMLCATFPVTALAAGPATYTVFYLSPVGELVGEHSFTAISGEEQTIIDEEPTRPHWVFDGWTSSEESDLNTYWAGNTYTYHLSNKNVVFTAHWKNPFSVYMNPDGTIMHEEECIVNEHCEVIAETPIAPDGKEFSHWISDFEGTGKKYYPAGTDFASSYTMPHKVITFNPVFVPAKEEPKPEPPVTPPVEPTEPPVEPTEPPVEPTEPPVEPTEPPVEPTEPPVEPTEPPVEPTEPPVEPTEPPVEPTEPPVEPTEPPVEPTEPPVEPTEPPVEPTEPPVEPTEPPVEPTEPPVVPETPVAPPAGPTYDGPSYEPGKEPVKGPDGTFTIPNNDIPTGNAPVVVAAPAGLVTIRGNQIPLGNLPTSGGNAAGILALAGSLLLVGGWSLRKLSHKNDAPLSKEEDK